MARRVEGDARVERGDITQVDGHAHASVEPDAFSLAEPACEGDGGVIPKSTEMRLNVVDVGR